MEIPFVISFIALVLILVALVGVRQVVIHECERGLLYRQGSFIKVLEPGQHFYFRLTHEVTRIDVRTIDVTIPGQEVLSADNVGLKISLAAAYRVSDPYLAVTRVVNYQTSLYLLLQVHLRELVGAMAMDDILLKREEIGKQLYEKSRDRAAEIGIELQSANIKDLMFPGDLKNVFAQVVTARKEAQAALERARGETAVLRSLANTAGVFDNNPGLLQLRLLQVMEKNSGNTVVLVPADSNVATKLLNKSPEKGSQ